MNEFEIIQNYFSSSVTDSSIILGIGDDAAIVEPDAFQNLAICVDTLVEKVHFPASTNAYDIAYKAVAVNLSDLAAMGAEPKWITLALTLPNCNEQWLADFSKGLAEICQQFNVSLIGGDTTRGPLSVTVQAQGFVPKGKALRRKGAKVGDKIFVTKTLGAAALGLHVIQGKLSLTSSESFIQELNRPIPAVKQGLLLREYANSCIDISDGFLADLEHLLTTSQVGAEIDLNKIPLPKTELSQSQLLQFALTGGDDYGLCFTVAANKVSELLAQFSAHRLMCHEVGEIIPGHKLKLLNQEPFDLDLKNKGYLHF